MYVTTNLILSLYTLYPDGFGQPPSHLSNAPAARAAGIARAAMLFRQKLKQGLITPEATKEGPLCMDTYRSLPFMHLSSWLSKLNILPDGCLTVLGSQVKVLTGVFPTPKQATLETLATSL